MNIIFVPTEEHTNNNCTSANNNNIPIPILQKQHDMRGKLIRRNTTPDVKEVRTIRTNLHGDLNALAMIDLISFTN